MDVWSTGLLSDVARDVSQAFRDGYVLSTCVSFTAAEEAQLKKQISRSPEWRKVREKHLQENDECAACGHGSHLEVHHIVPFHIDPSRELDPKNLVTLCGKGIGGMNCHLVIGHCGNWHLYSADVHRATMEFASMMRRFKP